MITVVSAPTWDGTGCEFDSSILAVLDIYPMFIEPTITWVPSGFSGYIWLDTKIVLKKIGGTGMTIHRKIIKIFILEYREI